MTPIFLDKDALLTSQAAVPIYFLLFREAVAAGASSTLSRAQFIEFQTARAKNREIATSDITKAEFELLEYDRLSQQGTNDASSIKERLSILRKYCGV